MTMAPSAGRDGRPAAIFAVIVVTLTLVRLAGIAVAFVGLVWSATDKFGPPSAIGGSVLIVAGLFGSLLLARRMRRGWLAPRE